MGETEGNVALTLVKAQEGHQPELLTSAQIADRLGIAKSTADRRIRDAGLKPTVEAKPGRYDATPALYDFSVFNRMEEEEEEAIRLEKHRQLVKKHVDALTVDERSEVMHETIEELRADFSPEASKAIMANALGFMQMLYERIGHQEAVIEQLGNDNTALNRQLDQDQNTGTLEKFNEEFNWHATATQLSQLSRRLGKHYTRVSVISIEHPKGVWSYERADVIDSQTRFPHFWEGILPFRKSILVE